MSGALFGAGCAAPGAEARLRYAYIIRCEEVVKDPETGEVTELRCTYDPATRGGNAPDGRKVKGTIHWVSAAHAFKTEVRLYDRLFEDPKPDSNKHKKNWKDFVNSESIKIIRDFSMPYNLAPSFRVSLKNPLMSL